MDNVIEMFGIPILEYDGYTDPFDDGTQYTVNENLNPPAMLGRME